MCSPDIHGATEAPPDERSMGWADGGVWPWWTGDAVAGAGGVDPMSDLPADRITALWSEAIRVAHQSQESEPHVFARLLLAQAKTEGHPMTDDLTQRAAEQLSPRATEAPPDERSSDHD